MITDGWTLGDLYRVFNAHLLKAVQHSYRSNHHIGKLLEECKIKLEAWADVTGYKNDVLERLDAAGGQLAASLREIFVELLSAIESVFFILGINSERPDGFRTDAIHYQLPHLFHDRLPALQAAILRHPAYRGDLRQKPSSPGTRTDNPTTHPVAVHQRQHSMQLDPPAVRDPTPSPSAAPLPVMLYPDVTTTTITTIKPEPPSSPFFDRSSLSRPSTAGSAHPISLTSTAPSSHSSLPSIQHYLHHSPPVTTRTSPATSSANSSPHSEIITPEFLTYLRHNPAVNPAGPGYRTDPYHMSGAVGERGPTLSPMQSRDGVFPSRPHIMEPPMESWVPKGAETPSTQSPWEYTGTKPRSLRPTSMQQSDYF